MAVKPVSVNPLKNSPALGAAYALQGIKGAIPLFHSAPGCTFLGKVLLTQHLREPVGLLGTDIKEIPTIMGGLEELKKRIIEVYEKFKPSLIGIIGTALSEVRGEDIEAVMSSEFGVGREKKQISLSQNSKLRTLNSKLVYIPAPDYMGGFCDGYAKAIEVMVENLAEKGSIIHNQINILPCSSLTIGDVEEIKDIVSDFGIKPIVLPDLSLSMDGSKERFSNLPLDGTNIGEIKTMGRSSATLCIGEGMRRGGEVLKERFDIPLHILRIPIGLEASDNFIRCLMDITGKKPSKKIERWRRRFVDGMVDTHLLMADKRIALGLEGEILSGIRGFCLEMGIDVLNSKLNDLEDLEDLAEETDLIITNSHGKEISERRGIPLLRMGFPVYDSFGEPFKLRAGYRGSLNLLFEMANIFIEGGEYEHYNRDYEGREGVDTKVYPEYRSGKMYRLWQML